ncbi:enoyl-CoA hydratase/carnithine racemase [Dichotomocladium elegans]|nr:enoyl-CoA hydratase/carnithine racemase [Dichotomocladium elegans]
MEGHTDDEVLLSIQDHVATIMLNRPRRGNALTARMTTLLVSMLATLKDDPNVRVLVLTGAGKYFCTGMDLMTATATGGEGLEDSFHRGLQVYDLLYHFPKPTIARVNGPALGGGVGLIFATDLRVVSDAAFIALTEVKRGIIPAIISQFIVPEVGRQRAREYMLTGRRVPAAEMAAYWSAVVDPAMLDATVNHYVDLLVDSAPGAMADIKQLVNDVYTGGQPGQHKKHVQQVIQDAYLKMMQSEEAAFGITAFINKEKPDWNRFLKDKAKL